MAKKLSRKRLRCNRHCAPFKQVIADNLIGSSVNFIHLDLTFGEGGFCELINYLFPSDKIIAFDVDNTTTANKNLQQLAVIRKFCLINSNFINIDKYLGPLFEQKCATIIIDLGYSNNQLADSELGLSYRLNAPLNMNYIKLKKITAMEIINYWTEKQLSNLFAEFGEEINAKMIASAICRERNINLIKTTFELVEIIKKAVPSKYRRIGHPARKTFQAIRIFINDELVNLSIVLPKCLKYLRENGRLFVITFNSLEDRIVKQFMRKQAVVAIGHKYLTTFAAQSPLKYKLIQRKPFKCNLSGEGVPNAFRCAKLRILVRKSTNGN